jgi:hypothetical protein
MTPEELNSLRSQGFVVNTNDDPDFFDSLFQGFVSSNEELKKSTAANKKVISVLEQFVIFAKNKLVQNPPVTITYLDRGLALQFSDYTRSVLVNNKDQVQKPGQYVAITESAKASSGPMTFKQVDASIPITR